MVLVHRRYEPCVITRTSGCTSVCSHDHVYVHCILTGHSIEIAASVKAQSYSKMCTCSRLVRACAHFLYRTIDHYSLPLCVPHDVIIVSALTTQTQAQLPACKTSPCLFRFTCTCMLTIMCRFTLTVHRPNREHRSSSSIFCTCLYLVFFYQICIIYYANEYVRVDSVFF